MRRLTTLSTQQQASTGTLAENEQKKTWKYSLIGVQAIKNGGHLFYQRIALKKLCN